MKYKVGDKVRVRKDLIVNESYGKFMFISDMQKYAGKEVIIEKIVSGAYFIEQEDGDWQWFWTDEMFEDGVVIMTLDDLETGMVVTTRKGGRYVFLKDCYFENEKKSFFKNINNKNYYMSFDAFKDDMTCSNEDCDIMEVECYYYPNKVFTNKTDKTIWRRNEPKKMTVAEISKELGYEVEVVAG